MKKQILVLTIFLLTLTVGQGQTNVYHPFPTDNASWSEIYFHQGYCDPPNYCPFELLMQGDTIINLESYHKIFARNDSSTTFFGGLRELNKKIYFFKQLIGYEYLLYDFNLNIGDSIMVDCDLPDTMFQKMIVASIDSILLIDMTYRRKFNFVNGESWIEGIGSEFGLLTPGLSCTTCICGNQLVCSRENDTLLYLNESLVPCFINTSNNEIINNSQQLIIYPNPFSSQMTVQSNQVLKAATLTIYNTFGQQVKQIKNISGQSITLHRDNLPSGIFFLQLTQDNEILTTDKIIITDN